MNERRNILKGGAGLVALGGIGHPGLAWSQVQPPAGPASIVSGFPAGGMGDNVARPIADKLRGRYAKTVIVESRTGAGGRIAVEHVKRAAPDGMTILQIPSSPMVLYPHTYKKLNYDALADFVPVCSTVTYAFSMTAGPGLPAEIRTVADYIGWAKANPQQANYGVPAAGSALHFAGMMLQKAAGVDLTSVPYRGGAPLLNDVLGGQIPVSINVVGEVLQHVRAGKLRSLAMTSAERSPFLPQVPTFAEQGFGDVVVQEWLGWFLPAATPPEIVGNLNQQVREALQQPEFIATLATNGLQPRHQSPAEFARIVKADFDRWAPVVARTGFKADE